MYVSLTEDGRIGATTSNKKFAEGMTEFTFPDDFDFAKQDEYKIQNGELIHDPKPKSEEELAAEKEVNRQQQIALAIPMMLQSNSASIPDAQAVQIPLLFREWKVGDSYTRNEIIQYDGELYRIGHDHTAQAQWVPGTVGMTALYSHIEIGEDN